MLSEAPGRRAGPFEAVMCAIAYSKLLLNFFPIGWPQLNAAFEQGFAYARSPTFYNQTLLWQWMRLPSDALFAIGVLLMALDFIIKLRPLNPLSLNRVFFPRLQHSGQPAE